MTPRIIFLLHPKGEIVIQNCLRKHWKVFVNKYIQKEFASWTELHCIQIFCFETLTSRNSYIFSLLTWIQKLNLKYIPTYLQLNVKTMRKMAQIFVAFSVKLNFTINLCFLVRIKYWKCLIFYYFYVELIFLLLVVLFHCSLVVVIFPSCRYQTPS